MTAVTPDAVLHFWFGEIDDGFADAAHRARWFQGGAAFDRVCRETFGELVTEVEAGALKEWLTAPRSSLAYILLCDQLPRNLHRGSARAFASDALARAATAAGILASFDMALGYDERAFYYLPLEHSEDLLDQHTSVGLFSELRDATPHGRRHLTGDYLRHAQQHRDLIRRFGRFPYRNAALGRVSTAAETAYLEQLDED